MQFHITALDGTDEAALDRRLAAREAHFAHARKKFSAGELLMGGAILNDTAQMIGSSLFVDIESREALDKWLAEDPYVKGDVWRTFDIKEVKLAKLD
jgi:uncharacterized protein